MATRVEEVVRELERRIVVGVYPVGSRLPNERALTSELGVSRTVLREAVARLEALGFLSREQGRGTFVRNTRGVAITMLLEANLSVRQMIERRGHVPGSRDVEVCREFPNSEVRTAFGLGIDDQVLVVRRVHTANRLPVVYSVNYLPLAPPPPEHPDAYTGSLYELICALQEKPVARALARIQPEKAGPVIAQKLEVSQGDLLLVLYQSHHVEGGKTVLCSRDSFRSDVFTIYVLRRPENF